jgi:hypothetical protein
MLVVHARHFDAVLDDPELFAKRKVGLRRNSGARGYKPWLISVRFMPGARSQPLLISAY